MELVWVPRQRTFDIEEMVLMLSLYAGLAACVWIWLGIPVPDCPFYAFTGVPCLTCGMTRAVNALMRGYFSAALYANPLFSLSIFALFLFDVYAVAVISAGWPRARIVIAGKNEADVMRMGAICLFFFNWAFMVISENGHQSLFQAFLLP